MVLYLAVIGGLRVHLWEPGELISDRWAFIDQIELIATENKRPSVTEIEEFLNGEDDRHDPPKNEKLVLSRYNPIKSTALKWTA